MTSAFTWASAIRFVSAPFDLRRKNRWPAVTHSSWPLAALLAATLIAPIGLSTAAQGRNWSPDPTHTAINSSVNHFFTPVKGSFQDYEIDLHYDSENPERSTVEARIQVNSVDTGNKRRDKHLRSADWFEAGKYPYITFRSTSLRKVSDNRLVASGPLTIKGKAQQIELPITLLGNQMIPQDMQRMLGGTREVASFEASTSIDRGDFGVGVGSWAATMVVGGEVDIDIQLEAHGK